MQEGRRRLHAFRSVAWRSVSPFAFTPKPSFLAVWNKRVSHNRPFGRVGLKKESTIPTPLLSIRCFATQKQTGTARKPRPVDLLEEEEEELAAPLVVVSEKETDMEPLEKKKKKKKKVIKKEAKEEQQAKKERFTEPVLKERLAKRLARSGICSRRDAEDLIRQGSVMVDGVVVRTPAITVGPENEIKYEGAKIPRPPEPKIWLHYKVKGVVVTHKDPEGRFALFPYLKRMGYPYMVSVGRLDYASEGLLLLTNNPGLAHYLEHPDNCLARKYKVRIRGELTETIRDKLSKGVRVKGVDYAPIEASVKRLHSQNLDPEKKAHNQWLWVTLQEGKNREIRKVFQHFNLTVTRIVRIQYGPFKLKKRMLPGDTLELDAPEGLLKKAGEEFWWKW